MFSMTGEIAHDVFWDLFRDAQQSRRLPVGRRSADVFGNGPAYAFPVALRHYLDYLGWSYWFYGGRDDIPCFQIVWSDRTGIFPWEAGADASFAKLQPDLTEKSWLSSLAD